MKLLTSVLAFGCIGTSAMAGPYVDVGGAYTINGDQEAKNEASGTVGHLTLDDGAAAHLAGGWDFDTKGPVDARAELELGYGFSDYKVATITNGGLGASYAQTGQVTNFACMANGYADINLVKGNDAGAGKLDWYVGLGLGVANLDTDPILSDTGATLVRGWKAPVLAGQAMTGLTYHFDEHWALRGGYRYFVTDSMTVDARRYEGNEVHAFEIGLRYTF